MKTKILFIVIFIGLLLTGQFKSEHTNNSKIPVIAIANYGPHSSLEDSIKGIKQELTEQGYIEGRNIIYDIADVGFDSSLIPQMITTLKAKKPQIMIAMTTPVAQFAKHSVKEIPLIYNVITDPVEAGLLKNDLEAENNTTCVADKQNLDLLLAFAKKLIPNAKKVGILYATSEANDLALIKMMEEAAQKINMQVLSIAIDQARDVPMRMQAFKDKVDFIYVGTSGPIQPTLPAIIAQADKMMIPVFNANEESVYNNQALASYGVNYVQIGKNTGSVISNLLKQSKIPAPIYPASEDHYGFISKKKAAYFGINIPKNLPNVTIVE